MYYGQTKAVADTTRVAVAPERIVNDKLAKETSYLSVPFLINVTS
jgi:hypothetical protein